MTARDTDWDGVRLHVVTGKGGTGKTTVAAALALALAHAGRKVLLIEAEGRQGIARLFDRPPLPYAERKIAIGPGEADDGRDAGGDVYALAIDPEGALLDYLQMFYNLRGVGNALNKLGMVDFATTIAPGLSDVLVTGKATEATRRRQPGSPTGFAYDAVVLDAPPTGRIGRFLNVTAEVSGLAKVGPVRAQHDLVHNPVVNGGEQLLLGADVIVEGAFPDAVLVAELVGARGVVTPRGEHLGGRVHDLVMAVGPLGALAVLVLDPGLRHRQPHLLGSLTGRYKNIP